MEGVPPEVVVAQKARLLPSHTSSKFAMEVASHELSRSAGIIHSLPPGAIVASQVHDGHADHQVTNLPLGHSQAWCGKNGEINEVTVDLLGPRLVTAISLQGTAEHNQFVKRFELETSSNGSVWNKEGVYTGCFDNTTVVKRPLQTPRWASFVKLRVLEFHGHPSTRMDVLVA